MSAYARRVLAAFLTAVMAVSVMPCPRVFADKKKFSPEAADFTSYELVTCEGEPIKLGVENTSFTVETDATNAFELALCTADDGKIGHCRIHRMSCELRKVSEIF